MRSRLDTIASPIPRCVGTNLLVAEEMEYLEIVELEVTRVLGQVGQEDTPVKVTCSTTAVHRLTDQIGE